MAPKKKKLLINLSHKQRRRQYLQQYLTAASVVHRTAGKKLSELGEINSESLMHKLSKNERHSEQSDELPLKNPVATCSDETFSEKLKRWIFTHKLTHIALTELLKILRSIEELKYLPKCAATFLETPTDSVVEKIIDGEYFYFGLSNILERTLKDLPNLPDEVQLIMGFDGAPLTESGKKEFWPIMVGFLNIPLRRNTVFTAALYCSEVNLEVPEDIFKDFVPELNHLNKYGLTLNGKHVKIKMDAYCMDAPAKAKVLGIKSCGGFSSCSRCWVVGQSFGNRRSYQAQTCRLRSHSDWIEEKDESFHVGPNCLFQVAGIDFSTQIPLDSMHLVSIGVQKKLLSDLWVDGKHKNKFAKLKGSSIATISARLKILNSEKYLSRDFANFPRGLDYVHKWKATEFRTFLLYIGLVVLESVLCSEAYDNFLRLHVGMTILLSKILCQDENIKFADEQLRTFVEEFASLYGEDYVSHNVHGLIHLAQDASYYVPLDNVSAFRFENHLGQQLALVNKPSEAVQQVP